MAQDVLDSLMGFDPTSLDVFQETTTSNVNPNIYKTNPKDSKSEDGIYRSKVRVIYSPYNPKQSIVTKTEWYCKSYNGSFLVNAPLSNRENDRNNPLEKASSTVFLALNGFADRFALYNYPGDGNAEKRSNLLAEFNSVQGRGKEAWAKKFKETELGRQILDYAKATFDNTTSTWALVQILEDENKPELEGQFKLMKLPKAVYTKLMAKMNPSSESKKSPVDLMSWVLGYPLEMEVQPGPDDPAHPERKQREISYDLCDFSTEFEPIRKVDNTPLFTDAQLEILEEYSTAKKDAESAKAVKKREEAAAKIAKGSDLYNKVLNLTKIAYTYLKDEVKVLDVHEEIAYKPWNEEMTKRVQDWVNEVTLMNPMTIVASDVAPTAMEDTVADTTEVTVEEKENELPF